MDLLHDIAPGDPKDIVNVVIEIPLGSGVKYEYHHDVKTIVVDRFLYTAFTYPFNYGFIPQTWSGDEDALDIVVLSSQPVATGVIIECKLLGILATEDEEGVDAKLVAVPKSKIDPFMGNLTSLEDLPDAVKNKIQHFYENYKSIEPGKWVKVTDWLPRQEAIRQVDEAIQSYLQKFSK